MIQNPSKPQLTLWLVLVVALILYALYAVFMFSWFQEQRQQQETLEMRLSRIQGLQLQREEILRQHTQSQEQLSSLIYPASQEANSVSTQLQQQIRQTTDAFNIENIGSRILEPRDVNNLQEVSINIRANMDLEQLESFLMSLNELRPLVFIQDLQLQPTTRARGTQQLINANMQLMSLRMLHEQ